MRVNYLGIAQSRIDKNIYVKAANFYKLARNVISNAENIVHFLRILIKAH